MSLPGPLRTRASKDLQDLPEDLELPWSTFLEFGTRPPKTMVGGRLRLAQTSGGAQSNPRAQIWSEMFEDIQICRCCWYP